MPATSVCSRKSGGTFQSSTNKTVRRRIGVSLIKGTPYFAPLEKLVTLGAKNVDLAADSPKIIGAATKAHSQTCAKAIGHGVGKHAGYQLRNVLWYRLNTRELRSHCSVQIRRKQLQQP